MFTRLQYCLTILDSLHFLDVIGPYDEDSL